MRLLALVVLTTTLSATHALKCFHCHDCDSKTASLRECGGGRQCYSLLGPVTRRGCSFECPFNPEFPQEECHMCSDDLCNHHQQGHFLRKAVHHRGGRHRRQEPPSGFHLSSTHYMPDGSKKEHYVDAKEEIPALPSDTDDIIMMEPTDPRFGTVAADGAIYVPIDSEGKPLPGYEHLLPVAPKGPPAPVHKTTVTEKQVDVAGDQVIEVITDNVVLPPGVSKEDIVTDADEESEVLGRVVHGGIVGSSDRKSEAEIQRDAELVHELPKPKFSMEELEEEAVEPPAETNHRRHTLPPIPDEMSEEEMNRIAEQIESILDEEDAEEEEEKKAEPKRPAIGEGARPTPKPDAAASASLSLVAVVLLILNL